MHKKKQNYKLRIAKINKKIKKQNKLYKKIFNLKRVMMDNNNKINNKQNRDNNNKKMFKIKQ